MYPKGFSVSVQGANSGILRPLKAITNMVSDKKYQQMILRLTSQEYLNTIFKDFLGKELFQDMINDKEKLLDYYMKISLLNNLEILNFQDKSSNLKILSNTNITYSYYPYSNEYPEKDKEKLLKFNKEVEVLNRISKLIEDENLDNGKISEMFLELVDKIVNKPLRNSYVTNNKYIETLSDLKNKILNDEILTKLVGSYIENKIHSDINKQGSDGKNNIFYNSPVFLSEKAMISISEYKIDKFSLNLPNILQNSVSMLNPVILKKQDSNFMSTKDLFKFVRYYTKLVRIFEMDKKADVKEGCPISYVLEYMIKLNLKNDRVFVNIKNMEKEISMKTKWFEIGKQFSVSIYYMHKNKAGSDQWKAIASTKEELVNSITMKSPKVRSDLIIKKYIVKFQLNNILAEDPDSLLEMSEDGLKEFILGLYCKNEKIEKKDEV